MRLTYRLAAVCMTLAVVYSVPVTATDGYYTRGYSPGHRAGAFYGNGPERYGNYRQPQHRGYRNDTYRRHRDYDYGGHYGYAPDARQQDYYRRGDDHDYGGRYQRQRPQSRSYNPRYRGYRDGRRSRNSHDYGYQRPRRSIVQPQNGQRQGFGANTHPSQRYPDTDAAYPDRRAQRYEYHR